jgi:hypothetical protein
LSSQFTEGLVVKDIPALVREVLPLKNGAGQMELGAGRAAVQDLRMILGHEPELLTALHSLAEGRRSRVMQEQIRTLKEMEFVTRSGQVRPDIRAVMIAGYRDEAGRPFIDEPFDLRDPQHAAIAQRCDELVQQALDQAKPTKLLIAELRDRRRKDKGWGPHGAGR